MKYRKGIVPVCTLNYIHVPLVLHTSFDSCDDSAENNVEKSFGIVASSSDNRFKTCDLEYQFHKYIWSTLSKWMKELGKFLFKRFLWEELHNDLILASFLWRYWSKVGTHPKSAKDSKISYFQVSMLTNPLKLLMNFFYFLSPHRRAKPSSLGIQHTSKCEHSLK